MAHDLIQFPCPFRFAEKTGRRLHGSRIRCAARHRERKQSAPRLRLRPHEKISRVLGEDESALRPIELCPAHGHTAGEHRRRRAQRLRQGGRIESDTPPDELLQLSSVRRKAGLCFRGREPCAAFGDGLEFISNFRHARLVAQRPPHRCCRFTDCAEVFLRQCRLECGSQDLFTGCSGCTRASHQQNRQGGQDGKNSQDTEFCHRDENAYFVR